jgi:hypothetical protein
MAAIPSPSKKRFLDPIDRILEVLFGLIMVLTFTLTLGAAEAGREDVRTMLIGALGCNIAWGIIDGLFYLMECLAERGGNVRTLHDLRNAKDPEAGRLVIADALPPLVAEHISDGELEALRSKLIQPGVIERPPYLTRDEFLSALAICGIVILTTLPVAVPFLIMSDAVPALRVSNAIAVTLMFIAGYSLGKISNLGRWKAGFAMVALGTVIVLITIALGG